MLHAIAVPRHENLLCAGAAIILRTDLQLRLASSRSFLGADQTNFATAIRSLLAPYSFMSVAVSAFQASPLTCVTLHSGLPDWAPVHAPKNQQLFTAMVRSLLAPYSFISVVITASIRGPLTFTEAYKLYTSCLHPQVLDVCKGQKGRGQRTRSRV